MSDALQFFVSKDRTQNDKLNSLIYIPPRSHAWCLLLNFFFSMGKSAHGQCSHMKTEHVTATEPAEPCRTWGGFARVCSAASPCPPASISIYPPDQTMEATKVRSGGTPPLQPELSRLLMCDFPFAFSLSVHRWLEPQRTSLVGTNTSSYRWGNPSCLEFQHVFPHRWLFS